MYLICNSISVMNFQELQWNWKAMAAISPQTHLKPRNVDREYIAFNHCLLAADQIRYVSHPNYTLSQVGISRTIWQLEVSGAVNPTLSWINLEVSNATIAF